MRVLRVFFVGLIFGLLLKWILDRILLEDNLPQLTEENAILRQRIRSLEAPRAQQNRPVQTQETDPLPVEELAPVAAMGSVPVSPHRDDLKMIKGIGPQIEKKLNTAGVYTFDQVSRLTTEQMQAILGGSKRNAQNIDNLISQAKKFADDGPKG
jgi:predicted flap endonuclease-1-like 5' DNA nuclease